MRHTLRILLAAVVALAGSGAALPAAHSPTDAAWVIDEGHQPRIARIETLTVSLEGEAPISMSLREWMALHRIPGLSVAVFDGHRIVWAKAYGVREAGGTAPVALDTLFQAGSISKPVTALAVMRHAEAGKWMLDEPVNGKLASWKVPDNEFTARQKVTLRRLLSHSAGTTVHGFPGYAAGGPLPTVVQVLDGVPPANTAPVRVDVVPGTRTRYSGGGTTIVQLMMVDQLGKPFPQIMQEAVFGPLGLKDSTFEQPLPPGLAARAASGTRADGTVVPGRWHVYPEMAAAGLWTTASDLARVAIEVAKAKAGKSRLVLSQAATKEMLTLQSESFGIGFAVEKGSDRFGHNGADEGFQALLTAFADTGRGVAIMANSDNGFALFPRLAARVETEYGWPSEGEAAEPLFSKVYVLARVRGADRAVAWYRTLRKTRAASELAPVDLNRPAALLLRDGSPADAARLLEASVQLHPATASTYTLLARARLDAGNREGAVESARLALELDPGNTDAAALLEKLRVK